MNKGENMNKKKKLQTVALCQYAKECEFKDIRKPNTRWKKKFPYCTSSETCSQKIEVEETLLRRWNYHQIKKHFTPHLFSAFKYA